MYTFPASRRLRWARKEFFTQILREIEENYFPDGLWTHLQKDYYNIGIIFGEHSVFNFCRSRYMKCVFMSELDL